MIAALAAFTLAYSFPAGSRNLYDFEVSMEGYIPLLGKPESSAEVKLVVEVVGGANQAVTCDLLDMKASLSGVPLPFGVSNIKAFFPKAYLQVSPNGRVLKTDVPDIQLPVRLPGLDPKRLPDITFLPIEFPDGDVEQGKSWQFIRSIGGADAHYSATAKKVDDGQASIDVKLEQKSTTYENGSGDEVKDEKSAENKIETVFTGAGTVIFDRKKGLAKSFVATSEAVSQVTRLKDGAKSERRVKSKLRSELRSTS